VHDGIRVATPVWTLTHLAHRPDRVELAMESALRLGLATDAVLREEGLTVVERRRLGAPATGSFAETRFLQRIVRPLGLDDPERQVPVASGGPRPFLLDFVFRRGSKALDVEIDGRETHEGEHPHELSIRRDHVVKLNGCEVLRIPAWWIERRRRWAERELTAELGRL
jgi:hypothetical protein